MCRSEADFGSHNVSMRPVADDPSILECGIITEGVDEARFARQDDAYGPSRAPFWRALAMPIELGHTERDRVAKAIYETQVKQAREHIDKLPFAPQEVEDLARRLKDESQTAQVLIFYSYLDDRIQQLIQLQLRPDQSKTETDRLFGANGPLSTFNSRILIAYHLGWLSDGLRKKLDAFRKIRNEFAHRAFKVTIDDPSLKPHLAALDFGIPAMLQNTDVKQKAMFDSLLCQLVMLALHTFHEMLVLPAAKLMSVAPNDVAGTFDDARLIRRDVIGSEKSELIAPLIDVSELERTPRGEVVCRRPEVTCQICDPQLNVGRGS